jgi:hypothetical protein
MFGQPGTGFFHRAAVGDAVEFHAGRESAGGIGREGRKIR